LAYCRTFALTLADIAAIQTRVSRRVLRWFVRRGWLDADDARAMREWHNDGGFSLDVAVRIPGWDRAGLERLLRYCARPPFALEHLEAIDNEHLRYHLSKARLPKRGLAVVYESVQNLVAALAEFSAVNYGRWGDKRNLNTKGAKNAKGLVSPLVGSKKE